MDKTKLFGLSLMHIAGVTAKIQTSTFAYVIQIISGRLPFGSAVDKSFYGLYGVFINSCHRYGAGAH